MEILYKNSNGVIKSALDWVSDMGGIEVVVGRPLLGAPDESLIKSIMAENGLSEVKNGE